jgi:hypothetical protein
MRILLISALVLLTGCSTVVPVTAKFPSAPTEGLGICGPLTEVADNAQLSDITVSVADNYRLYHECAVKVNIWQEWYTKQRDIFNKVSQ